MCRCRPRLRPAEIEHIRTIATIFQPDGWNEISARAETRKVIRPLDIVSVTCDDA